VHRFLLNESVTEEGVWALNWEAQRPKPGDRTVAANGDGEEEGVVLRKYWRFGGGFAYPPPLKGGRRADQGIAPALTQEPYRDKQIRSRSQNRNR
jgi:hypothetical protein